MNTTKRKFRWRWLTTFQDRGSDEVQATVHRTRRGAVQQAVIHMRTSVSGVRHHAPQGTVHVREALALGDGENALYAWGELMAQSDEPTRVTVARVKSYSER